MASKQKDVGNLWIPSAFGFSCLKSQVWPFCLHPGETPSSVPTASDQAREESR